MSTHSTIRPQRFSVITAATTAVVVLCCGGALALASEITSVTFTIDTAALVANRYVGTVEFNSVQFLKQDTGELIVDISDDLFGTSAWPAVPLVNQGSIETGHSSVTIIDPELFTALQTGNARLLARLSDTDDSKFAIDFLSVAAEMSDKSTLTWYCGWPSDGDWSNGDENDGFGLGAGTVPDGGDLPAPLDQPGSVQTGATGTGFDEVVGTKAPDELIPMIPEPAALLLLGMCAAVTLRRR